MNKNLMHSIKQEVKQIDYKGNKLTDKPEEIDDTYYKGNVVKFKIAIHKNYCSVEQAFDEIFGPIFENKNNIILLPKNNKKPSEIETPDDRIKRKMDMRLSIRTYVRYYMEEKNITLAKRSSEGCDKTTDRFPIENLIDCLLSLKYLLSHEDYRPKFDNRSKYYGEEMFPIIK